MAWEFRKKDKLHYYSDLGIFNKDNGSSSEIADVWSSEEDARLMATAPELLEKLEDLVALLKIKKTDAFDQEQIDSATALIAKAKGKIKESTVESQRERTPPTPQSEYKYDSDRDTYYNPDDYGGYPSHW